MTNKMISLTFALGFLSLGMTTAMSAQTPDGTIRGTVLDPTGALIPQAQVTVTNAEGFSRSLTSDAAGAFELPHLAAGSYTVSINASGFTPALEGVQVSASTVTNENVTLGISVSQEIDVTADDDAGTPGNNVATVR